jgi:hypothetical protein
VAILAVFIGPFVSLRVANKQITAPMLQIWTNALRDLLAEFIATADQYAYEPEKLTDEAHYHLSLLEYRIRFMLNLEHDDHRKLDAVIRQIASLRGTDFSMSNEFEDLRSTAIKWSREVLKRHWDRAQEPIKLV